MNCSKCGHPKESHDSDADYRFIQEWCDEEGCDCDCFIEEVENEKIEEDNGN